MAVGDGSMVAEGLGRGEAVGGTNVGEGTRVGACVSVAVGTTNRVTVGGMGVVKAPTARAVRGSRLIKASARQAMTAQNAPKSRITRLTWLRGTMLRSNCMGIRV